jgi:formylmethanofuran dehydrogenase subunit D
MDNLFLTLITGRSTKQGSGISIGKAGTEYRDATQVIDLSMADMKRSGIHDGESVQLRTEFGIADVKCRQSEVPEGLAFMAFGPVCNQLVGEETYASGMPDSKHVKIEVLRKCGGEL